MGKTFVNNNDPTGLDYTRAQSINLPVPIPPLQTFSFPVKCNGLTLGTLDIQYAISQTPNTPKGQVAPSFGAAIQGGLNDIGIPPITKPCCCDGLEFIQIVTTNLAKGGGWGRKEFLDANPPPFFTGATGIAGDYLVEFRDFPRRPWNGLGAEHNVMYWFGKLCLVCTHPQNKTFFPLKCVSYGFGMSFFPKGGEVDFSLLPLTEIDSSCDEVTVPVDGWTCVDE